MLPVISVVIPIYKVENYLSRCIDSLINQTYKNIEIILVDDGSPDNCPKMCDDYAKKDSRIKVVHKNNGGLSDARNAGMKVATGELISFIDSDDYISLDFFEELYTTMENENSDLVECSVVKFYEDNHFDDYIDDLIISNFNTVDGLSALISENPFHQHVWNKLYRRNLVIDIPYAVGKLNEDEFWTYQVFGRAKKVTKLNKSMYYYFQRSDSIMGENFNIRRLDALEGKCSRQKYIDELYPSLSLLSKFNLYDSLIYSGQSILKFMSGKEKKRAWQKLIGYKKYAPNKSEIISLKNVDKKWYRLANFSLWVCCKIKAVTGKGFGT